jgi:hypothetical protein
MTVNEGENVELDENGLPPNKVNPDEGQGEEHRVGEQDPNGKPDESDENLEDTQPAK